MMYVKYLAQAWHEGYVLLTLGCHVIAIAMEEGKRKKKVPGYV